MVLDPESWILQLRPPTLVVQRCLAGAVLLGLGLYVGSRIATGWRRGGRRSAGAATTFHHKLTVHDFRSDIDEVPPQGGATAADKEQSLWRDVERQREFDSYEDVVTISVRDDESDTATSVSNPDPPRATSITPTPASGIDVFDEDGTDSDTDEDDWSYWRPTEGLVIWNSAQASLPSEEPEATSDVYQPKPEASSAADQLESDVAHTPKQEPEIDEGRWGRRHSSMDTILEEEYEEEWSDFRSPRPNSGSSSHSNASDSDGVYNALYSSTTTTRQQRPLEEINDDVLADLQDDPDFRSLMDCGYEEEDDTTEEEQEVGGCSYWPDYMPPAKWASKLENQAEELESLRNSRPTTPHAPTPPANNQLAPEMEAAKELLQLSTTDACLHTVHTYAQRVSYNIIQDALLNNIQIQISGSNADKLLIEDGRTCPMSEETNGLSKESANKYGDTIGTEINEDVVGIRKDKMVMGGIDVQEDMVKLCGKGDSQIDESDAVYKDKYDESNDVVKENAGVDETCEVHDTAMSEGDAKMSKDTYQTNEDSLWRFEDAVKKKCVFKRSSDVPVNINSNIRHTQTSTGVIRQRRQIKAPLSGGRVCYKPYPKDSKDRRPIKGRVSTFKKAHYGSQPTASKFNVQSSIMEQSTQTETEQSSASPLQTERSIRKVLKKLSQSHASVPSFSGPSHLHIKSKTATKVHSVEGNSRRSAKRQHQRHPLLSDNTTTTTTTRQEMAYVTVVTDNLSTIGAVVLGCSIRRAIALTNSDIPTASLVAILNDELGEEKKQLLANVYDHVFLTSDLYSHDDLALQLLGRPELGATLVKLHCWRLTQYTKCVYLDADTLVLQNCDELFEREELSAVPDTGWPDCFNSGVFVFRPSLDTYSLLVSLAAIKPSFDGGDQGLLNAYFGTSWRANLSRRLPFIYNVVSSLSYTYAPAYKYYESTVKIVHFLGQEKPWSVQWRSASGDTEEGPHLPVLRKWIDLFRNKVLPQLPQVARDAASTTPYVSVLHLLHQINVRRAESANRGGDPLVQAYFPDRDTIQNPSSSWQQFIPTESQRPQSPRHHQDHQQHHDHHHHHSHQDQHHQEHHHTSESTHSAPSEHHRYHHQEEAPRNEPYPEYSSGGGDYSAHHHQEPVVQQPVDPHWEALLWHAVQTPWEPPPPPSVGQYTVPWSEPHHEELTAAEKTFGWFSADTGARSDIQSIDTNAESKTESAAQPSSPQSPSLCESQFSDGGVSHHAETASRSEEDVAPPLPETAEQSILRMKSWEDGQIDYLGQDRFENIWKRLESMFKDEEEENDDDDDQRRRSDSEIVDLSVSALSETLSTGLFLQPDEESVDHSETASVTEDGGGLTEDVPTAASVDTWIGYPENDYSGMYAWQEGNVDYCGRDCSDNIMRRLDQIMASGTTSRPN